MIADLKPSNRNLLKALKAVRNNPLTTPTPLFKFTDNGAFRPHRSMRFSILFLFTLLLTRAG